MKPASKEQPPPTPTVASGHRIPGWGLVLCTCLDSLSRIQVCLQPHAKRYGPPSMHSIDTHVGRKRISAFRCLAIFCLNELMPGINIVCEFNCLLGRKGKMNRV